MATETLLTVDHVHMQVLSNCIFIIIFLLANLIANPLYKLAILIAMCDMALLFSQQEAKLLALL